MKNKYPVRGKQLTALAWRFALNPRSSVIGGVLGNVVISKKFLRTRKIMVMHSNERGEYDLRTL